jgi:hypothetical protein
MATVPAFNACRDGYDWVYEENEHGLLDINFAAVGPIIDAHVANPIADEPEKLHKMVKNFSSVAEV